MPPPEQLGIAAPGAIDWAAVHQRLDRLGVTCFQMDRPVSGGCHIVCLVPSRQPGQHRRVEAQAATQAEAIRVVLDRAEEWALTARR
jgi:hypothetical protein